MHTLTIRIDAEVEQALASLTSEGQSRSEVARKAILDLPLSTWIIAPTSTGRRAASFRPEIEIGGVKTRMIVEQLTVIDPQHRLGEFVGRLNTAEMNTVDAALRAVLALD